MKAQHSLQELMGAIYRIGTRVYTDEGERLFVHHMGDGFAIVSEFGEASFKRPLCIAAALMRHVATTGMFAAAAIAEGELSDITGCYPEEVIKDYDDSGVVRLGAGLMTLSSVMGTAFIRAYHLNGDTPSGPFVVVSAEHEGRIPREFGFCSAQGEGEDGLLSVDWMRTDTLAVAGIQDSASLGAPKVEELIQAIESYCAEYPHVRRKWSGNLKALLRVDLDQD